MLSLLITGSVLLSACAPETPTAQHSTTGGGHMQGSSQEAKNLVVLDESTDTEIAFSVQDGDEVFDDYGVSHTKEMHLIVVRDDLQHFQHLHPERDAKGIWRVPFTAGAGGTYWIYADFIEKDEAPHTLRFERTFTGEPGSQGIVKSFETVKSVDDYRFTFKPDVSGDEVTFTYDITDSQGQSVELEEYLGAKGHSVLISPSGDFIHTHASEEGEVPKFKTSLPSDTFYRAFTQFQIDGKVQTVSFDWNPSQPQ